MSSVNWNHRNHNVGTSVEAPLLQAIVSDVHLFRVLFFFNSVELADLLCSCFFVCLFFSHLKKELFTTVLIQDRDAQKIQWISRFVDELKNDKWVLPSLKQIREICQLFPEVGKCLENALCYERLHI